MNGNGKMGIGKIGSTPGRGIKPFFPNPQVPQSINSQTPLKSGMDEKRDIYKTDERYENRLNLLKRNNSVIPENKELILSFLHDCQLGKTIKKGQKKKIGKRRCMKYIYMLKRLSKWFDKPFSEVAQKDMEVFILRLDNDEILTFKGKPFSEESKADVKKAVRKFWKWMNGGHQYPDIVSWIDTTYKIQEIPAIKFEEMQRLVEYSDSPEKKFYVMLLFDSGARPEEAMNLRWSDLEKKQPESGRHYYMARIRWSKTKPRTISLPLCTEMIDRIINAHPEKQDSSEPLIPVEYSNLYKKLKLLGRNVLRKNIYPYIFRHSSITYYAKVLRNRQKLCYRYGWAMSSKEVDRYIDREGFEEEETAELVQQKETINIQKENERLKNELVLLREDMQNLQNGVEKRKDADTVMNALTQNPEALKQLVGIIKKLDLEDAVAGL